MEAQQVVTQAVAEARRTGAARISIVGHTDTSHARPGTAESQAYNQDLSERRADSVRAEMVRQGLSEASITTEGRSFNDLLVQTGPGVREPQNRRAVIDLNP
jgi:outer membrane protein OmpA-like peptidoglycan-associated protein